MNNFKYISLLLFLAIVIGVNTGCKKLLNVDPITAMSANNFWKTKDDVERFTSGSYALLRNYTAMDGHTLLAIGDYRCTPWTLTTVNDNNRYVNYFHSNDMRALINAPQSWSGTYGDFSQSYDHFGFENMSDWGFLFRVVTSANTILANIDSEEITDISEEERKRYKAEAIFLRAITYFFMVRHWGDLPYQTDVNDFSGKERLSQITIFKNCIADLKLVLEDLPWPYADPAKRGPRAMKGGAIILMMEMYMWMACFDENNQNSYFQEVVTLSNRLTGEGAGYYQLLPLDNTKAIFKGSSAESLFEIGQDANFDEKFGNFATIANLTMRTPYKPAVTNSSLYYNQFYLHQLYDDENNGATDARIDNWFERAYMYDNTGNFVFLKFQNLYGSDNPNDNKIIFRYADAWLLRAEALEKLGDYAGALQSVNVIRERAGATLFTGGENVTNLGSNMTLEDAIWWERERELMGENSLYYDLIRTKKILSSRYTPYTMDFEDFTNGAWTFPIRSSVLLSNSKLKPNPYWL